jgi:opacity protein-like surface antigen
MNKFLKISVLAIAAIAAAGSAYAQEVKPEYKWFAGPSIGAAFGNDGVNLGVNGGYEVNKYLRLEGTYDHVFNSGPWSIDNLAANIVGQYRIPRTLITPYALAGMGYQFQNGINQGVWNVGGGVRVDLSPRVDMDVRYRYIQGMYYQTNTNLVTVGSTIKF